MWKVLVIHKLMKKFVISGLLKYVERRKVSYNLYTFVHKLLLQIVNDLYVYRQRCSFSVMKLTLLPRCEHLLVFCQWHEVATYKSATYIQQ